MGTIGKFRLSVTTDNRSTFADGLSVGGAVAATWTTLTPTSMSDSNASHVTFTADGSNIIFVTGPGAAPANSGPLTDNYTIVATTSLTGITGIRLETLLDAASLNRSGPGRSSNGNFGLTEFTVDAVALPEPASLGVFAIAGGAMLVRRRSQIA